MSRDIKVLGVDLAKDVFQIYGTFTQGKKKVTKRIQSRAKFIAYMANLQPCLVGMEACGGSHFFARLFQSFGHEVKLMSPAYVKPYVKSNKNDANDAEGIHEAVTRPNMRFVSIKSVEQQAVLSAHRARQMAIKQRTAIANNIRGLLMEFGITIKKGINYLSVVPTQLETHHDQLPEVHRRVIQMQYEQFKLQDMQVNELTTIIEVQAKQHPICEELMKIDGVGVMTASAIVAAIGDASTFRNGREVAAWLGLTPKQHSSGRRIKLGRISKRGDSYLRTLLIHGARSAIQRLDNKNDKKSNWAKKVLDKAGYNKAAVAMANKHARIIWAIMSTGCCYDINHVEKA